MDKREHEQQAAQRRSVIVRDMSQCVHFWLGERNHALLGKHMGAYQNYGPLLGPLSTGCRIMLRTERRDYDFGNHPWWLPRLPCTRRL